MAQGSWRNALRTLAENPLAEAFELTRRRRLGRLGVLRRYGLSAAAILFFTAVLALVVFNPNLMGASPSPSEWPWIALLMVGIPLYCIWLLRSVYEVSLLSLQLLGRHGRRAAHLQLDDMLALTPLTGAEMVLGTVWSVVRPLVPVMVAGALLVWALGLGVTLDFGGSTSIDTGRLFSVLAAAPLTTLCMVICSSLALTTLSLWWVALGRGLKADQLSVGGALVYGLLQTGWIPLTLIAQQAGPFGVDTSVGFDPLSQFALGIVAAAFVIGGIYLLLSGTENMPAIRAGLAAIGPLLPICIIFAFVASLLAAIEINQSYVFYENSMFEAFIPNLILSFGGLMPLNPLAVPHPALLGFTPSEHITNYGTDDSIIWPTPVHFAGLLAIQLLLLWVCAAAATRSVELRRRAL